MAAGSPPQGGDDHQLQDEALSGIGDQSKGQSGDSQRQADAAAAQPSTDSGPAEGSTTDKAVKNASAEASQHIQIKVRSTDSNEVFFRIKKTTPLRKLMDVYCDRLGQPRGTIRFIYEGERITNDDTAQSLGIEDNEVIDAMIQQTGGFYNQML